jgi:hypothetical protein
MEGSTVRTLLIAVLVLAVVSPVLADDVGTVHFATSCQAETQKSFDHAVAALTKAGADPSPAFAGERDPSSDIA